MWAIEHRLYDWCWAGAQFGGLEPKVQFQLVKTKLKLGLELEVGSQFFKNWNWDFWKKDENHWLSRWFSSRLP
jgi:hypothetical protein